MGEEKTTGARIFLVDDHPAVRQGLALLLAQNGHSICGEAENRSELQQRVAACGAQVALLDLSLGEESGLDLLDDLRILNIPAIVYSMHEDRSAIERAFARGAHAYVTKREVSAVLLKAVDEVLSGRRFVCPRAAQSLANRVFQPEGAGGALSQREDEIMEMLGRGDSSVEIAKALSIGVRTVETYYARIIEKLGLSGMRELRKHAIRRVR